MEEACSEHRFIRGIIAYEKRHQRLIADMEARYLKELEDFKAKRTQSEGRVESLLKRLDELERNTNE